MEPELGRRATGSARATGPGPRATEPRPWPPRSTGSPDLPTSLVAAQPLPARRLTPAERERPRRGGSGSAPADHSPRVRHRPPPAELGPWHRRPRRSPADHRRIITGQPQSPAALYSARRKRGVRAGRFGFAGWLSHRGQPGRDRAARLGRGAKAHGRQREPCDVGMDLREAGGIRHHDGWVSSLVWSRGPARAYDRSGFRAARGGRIGDVLAPCARGCLRSVPMDSGLQQEMVPKVRSLDKRTPGREPSPGSAG